jgi:catechol 2,3-dioxygenase-like lactoylglutathione lyase family enzyme
MSTRLTYAICFVEDMEAATAFYRDTLGLAVRFASPFWTEMETGATTLALHPASAKNPAGGITLGFGVDDVEAFYAEKSAAGVPFIEPPREQRGVKIAAMRDSEGGEIRISG